MLLLQQLRMLGGNEGKKALSIAICCRCLTPGLDQMLVWLRRIFCIFYITWILSPLSFPTLTCITWVLDLWLHPLGDIGSLYWPWVQRISALSDILCFLTLQPMHYYKLDSWFFIPWVWYPCWQSYSSEVVFPFHLIFCTNTFSPYL